MLNKVFNSFGGRIVFLFLVLLVFYSMFRKDAQYNKYKCATKQLSLKGVIVFVTGSAGYRQVMVDNLDKPFSLNVNDEIYRKGFNKYHFFAEGDSIIKVANSKEVTIRNKDSIVVFTLSCDD